VQCKASLRWSCVRGFYLGSTASRRQLEHLTVSAGCCWCSATLGRRCHLCSA
jgi:hypothetical protein